MFLKGDLRSTCVLLFYIKYGNRAAVKRHVNIFFAFPIHGKLLSKDHFNFTTCSSKNATVLSGVCMGIWLYGSVLVEERKVNRVY